MFWKSDFWTKETKKQVEKFDLFEGYLQEEFTLVEPMFRNTKLAELGDVEDVEKDVEELKKLSASIERKLDLILNHLNLQYVPETEKKEAAKLIEKIDLSHISVGSSEGRNQFACIKSIQDYTDSMYEPSEPKKKKRGRPKKK